MSNRLKKLFSDEDEKYTETLTFDNPDSYKAFAAALEKVQLTGQGQMVEGIKTIRSSLFDGDNKYPISDEHSVERVVVGPYMELIEWPVQIEDRTINIEFYRTILKKNIKLTSVKKEIIDIEIENYLEEKKTVFRYNLHPEKAQNLEILIKEYKMAKALIMSLFRPKAEVPEYKDMLSFFFQSIGYFERLHELESALDIDIFPSKLESEYDKKLLIEKLYLLLVKHKKIRSNDRLNFIKADMFDGSIGQEILTAYIDRMEYEIFGQTIRVYIVNSIFNAVVSKIEDVQDKLKQVYFSDTDDRPMYRAYSGFLSEEEAIEEQNSIRIKIREYREAKKIDECLKELYTDEME